MRWIFAIGALLMSVQTATAAPPNGEWLVQDQTARVVITQCGPSLCGKISWSSDGKDVGRQILINMRPDGTQWTGTVVDVRDGTTYLAHLLMQSANSLKIDGCALGGVICSGETWTRYR